MYDAEQYRVDPALADMFVAKLHKRGVPGAARASDAIES
jgi:hypothetical protein